MGERILELSGIYKTFDGMDVLNGINLYIEKNEFLTLLGPSGCGKTTLLRMLALQLTPDAGTILLDGVDLWALSRNERARYCSHRIGYIPQDFALIPILTPVKEPGPVTTAHKSISSIETDISSSTDNILLNIDLYLSSSTLEISSFKFSI